MANIRFGFVVFEKCFHCEGLRTYFSRETNPILGDRYVEGDCHWTRMENAQSFQFDLECGECGRREKFDDLMGLMHCTGCIPECELDVQRQRYEEQRTFVIVAFGFLPETLADPIPQRKLDILTDYFNQRRDTSRSRIKVLPTNLIIDFPRCKGDFLHDVDMLSQDAPGERRSLF